MSATAVLPASSSPAHAGRSCTHCGTTFTPAEESDQFCCGGCAFVYNLITDSGLDRYYRLKGDSVTLPVKNVALQERDWTWLQERTAAAETEARNGTATLDLSVHGISCVGCVWLLERVFTRHPGGLSGRVRTHPGRMRLEWQAGQCDVAAFADQARQFGYLLGPAEATEAAAGTDTSFRSRLGLCGAFALNAMIFSLPRYLGMEADFFLAPVFLMIAAISATLSVLVGGTYFISRAWQCLRSGVLHIDLPIAIGIVAAWLGSVAGWLIGHEPLVYFDFVSVFTFLMLGGRRLQQAATDRNRSRILAEISGASDLRAPDGTRIAPEALTAEAVFLVSPGQTVPVAASVEASAGTVSLESITGEADPLVVKPGMRLAAGSVNIGRTPLQLRACEAWRDSLFRSLRDAESADARHPVLDTILRYAISGVLLIATAGAVWWMLRGAGLPAAMQVFISVLVISCPCALGVSLPLADELAARAAEKHGVFVRRPVFWQRLRRVRKIVADKTGTLTLEAPALANPDVLHALAPAARKALGAMVYGSLHPVSRSLLEAMHGAPDRITGAELTEEPGAGVKFTDAAGICWSLGRPGWNGAPAATGAVTFLCADSVPVAAFEFTDSPRPDAAAQLAAAQQSGMQVHILSGDTPEKVRLFAEATGIPAANAHGGLRPEQKAAALAEIDTRDTLYLGDGANDSLAFSHALCTGTPVADKGILETRADFCFLGRSLSFLSAVFTIADRRARSVRHMAAFAISYNIAGIGLALTGHMNPLLAAVLMPLSSLVTLAIARAAGQKARG